MRLVAEHNAWLSAEGTMEWQKKIESVDNLRTIWKYLKKLDTKIQQKMHDSMFNNL